MRSGALGCGERAVVIGLVAGSATWKDDAKSSRRAIVQALKLESTASNSWIFNAVRSKRGDNSVAGAIEETTNAETGRAKRLTAIAIKLDAIQKQGEELKREAGHERSNLGADKADSAKVAKKDELKREISAAVDAVDTLASDARKGAKEAAELAQKLKATWTGKDEDEKPIQLEDRKSDDDKKSDEKKEEKKDDKKSAAPPPKKPHKSEPAAPKKPAEDKPAKAPSQPTAPSEDFNP